MKDIPDIAFVGITERVSQRYLMPGREDTPITDILGLGDLIAAPVYPLSLEYHFLVLAIYLHDGMSARELKLLAPDGRMVFNFKLESFAQEPTVAKEMGVTAAPLSSKWTTVVLPLRVQSGNQGMIFGPGVHRLVCQIGASEVTIGEIRCCEVTVAELTPDRIAAIRSNPNAVKSVKYNIECNTCKSGIFAYASLERKPDLEAEGSRWYRDIPDQFQCSCGSLGLDLTYLRRNLHFFLGRPIGSATAKLEPLYTSNMVESIRADFEDVLARKANDELAIQSFMEEHPIVLSRFAAQRIFFRPTILTRYKADFAILAPGGELVLIEIERPNVQMVKADGAPTAEFNHAFDQANDWLREFLDHRSAALSCIAVDLQPHQVSRIRAVVIQGRDASVTEDTRRKLKIRKFGEVEFLTYDDLLLSLSSVASDLRKSRVVNVDEA